MSNETIVIKQFRNPLQEDRDLDSAHKESRHALNIAKNMLLREISSERWQVYWLGGDANESHSNEIERARWLIRKALKLIDEAGHHIMMDEIDLQIANDPRLQGGMMFQIVAGRFSILQDAINYKRSLTLEGTMILPDPDNGGFKVIAWRNGSPLSKP